MTKKNGTTAFSSNGHKRALLVARVSTDPQAQFGYSLPTQLKAMRKYAAEHGFRVPGPKYEITDDCSGTIPIYERPGGQQIYQAVKDRSVDVIVFYTIDRASRDEDVLDFIVLKRDLREAGIELHFCDTGKSEHDSLTGILDYIRVSEAGRERKKIIERTLRGKHAKAESGKYVGVGAAPYGYERTGLKKDTRLVVDPEEAEVVRQIFSLYTGQHGERLSVQKIAERMGAEGHSPPGGNIGPGRGWWCTSVNRILRRETYLGRLAYAGVTVERPELALIDRETWKAAQRQCEANRIYATRNRKREYLLASRLHCICGGSMTASTTRPDSSPYPHYKCCRSKSIDRHLFDCREGSVGGKVADAKVWEWLHGLVTNDAKLDKGLKRLAQKRAAEMSPLRARLAVLDEWLARNETRHRRLVGLYKDASKKELEELRAEVKMLEKQAETWQAERERKQAELAQGELTPDKQRAVKQTVREIRQRLGRANFAQRRWVIDFFDLQAQLRRDKDGKRWLDCTCAVPGWRKTIELRTC